MMTVRDVVAFRVFTSSCAPTHLVFAVIVSLTSPRGGLTVRPGRLTGSFARGSITPSAQCLPRIDARTSRASWFSNSAMIAVVAASEHATEQCQRCPRRGSL
jgi:hypothetical protein